MGDRVPEDGRADPPQQGSGLDLQRNRWTEGRSPAALSFFGALIFALELLPDVWAVPGCGLEAWVWPVNARLAHAAALGGTFYNYGPLGALVVPLPLGRDLFFSVAYRLAIAALAGALVFAELRRADARAAWGGWALLLLGAAFPGVREYCGLLALALLLARRDAPAADLLAALLAAALLFIKFSLGLGALLLLGASALASLAGAGAHSGASRAGRLRAARLAGGCAVSRAALAALLLGPPAASARWLRGSIEISSGYSAALSMVSGGPRAGLAAAGLALFALLLLALWLRGEQALALSAALLLPLPLLAFKHAFVRDDHVLLFCTLLPWSLALVLLQARTRAQAQLPLAASAAGALLTAALALAPGVPRFSLADGADALLPRPARDLVKTLRLGSTESELRSASIGCLQALRYPPELAQALAGHTVDLLDGDFERIPANDLDWSPAPMLEARGAVTPWLDEALAEHLRGERAPERLVVQAGDIDGRIPLLDAPAAWRTIREGYRPIASEPGGPRLVLARREREGAQSGEERRVARALLERSRARVETSSRIEVPPGPPLWLALHLAPTLRGRLARLFYRWPPIFVRLEYEDGQQAWARVLPDQLASGLPLAELPRDRDGLAAWLSRARLPRVRALHLSGPGLVYFAPQMERVWLEAP